MEVIEYCRSLVPQLKTPSLRNAVLAGGVVIVTGGLAYVVWNFFNTKRKGNAKRRFSGEKKHEEVVKRIKCEPARHGRNLCQEQERGTQVLVLGLDGAGKTSLLQCFASGMLGQDASPTKGFNAVSINRDDLHIEFLEIGGGEKFRGYWPQYLKMARVVVFVVNAADPSRFPLAKTHLHRLLDPVPHLPLVVLANKQDLPGACGVPDLFESLALGSIADVRKLYILGTQARKTSNELDTSIQDAYELIVEMMTSPYTH